MKMRKIFLLMICVTLSQMVYGQRLVRRNSRHYIELQTLPARVNPLLTDTWDQYAPFNNLCPIDSITKERSVVGCVATSMSQVMHFWQWPKTYDWDNILDKYVEGEYTQQQADAVAQLSLDCGEAVKMRYSSVESGARSIYQPISLVNNSVSHSLSISRFGSLVSSYILSQTFSGITLSLFKLLLYAVLKSARTQYRE